MVCQYLAPGEKPPLTPDSQTSGTTPDEPTVMESMQQQIEDLKNQVSTLAQSASLGPTPPDSLSVPESLLDMKIPSLKRLSLETDPTNTTFFGASSSLSTIFSGHLRDLLAKWNVGLNKERKALLQETTIPKISLSILGTDLDAESVIGRASTIAQSNFLAFKERLSWFATKLNHLVFLQAIPITGLTSFFNSTFGPISTNEVSALSTPDPSFCAMLAPIFAVIYLVAAFERFSNPTGLHRNQLNVSISDLRNISLQLLSCSDFTQKKSLPALIALVLLKKAIFCYDEIEHDNPWADSYTFHKLILGMAYQLGLHVPEDTSIKHVFKEKFDIDIVLNVTSLEKMSLWNLIKYDDAIYSINLGLPLSIDDRFCVPYRLTYGDPFEGLLKRGFELLKHVSLKINTLKPISLRELDDLINQILDYCYKIPYKYFEKENLGRFSLGCDDLCILFRIKLFFLELLQCLYRIVIIGTAEAYKLGNGTLSSGGQFADIRALCRESFRQTVILSADVLWHIASVFSDETIFGTDPRYVLFIKNLCLESGNQSFTIWLSFLFGRLHKTAQCVADFQCGSLLKACLLDNSGSTYKEDIDIPILERALYHRGTDISDPERDSVVKKLMLSSQIIESSFTYYSSTCKSIVMRSSIEGMAHLKFLLMWIYALQEVEKRSDKSNPKSLDTHEILLKAKDKLRREMSDNAGTPTHLNMDSPGDNLLDSFITDQNWIDSLFNN